MSEEEITEVQSARQATAVLKRINKTEVSANNTVEKLNEYLERANTATASIESNLAAVVKSASKASDKEEEATTSATAAATKAGEATTDATTATTKAGKATTSAATAATSAGEATTSAATATTKVDEATGSAAKAATQAVQAAAEANKAAKSVEQIIDKESKATKSAVKASSKLKAAEKSAEKAAEKEIEASVSAANAATQESATVAGAKQVAAKEKETTDSASQAKFSEDAAADSAKKAKRSAREAAEAHNLSTTAGLAGAFNMKATDAIKRMRIASFGLIIALFAIGYIGYLRFDEVNKVILPLIEGDSKNLLEALLAQILFFLIGAAAPIWLAWMSTRMISRYFQLSEDYSYKASVAQAYIGFKEQSKGLDELFEERLFAAAITQLDSNPLRFSESSSHPDSPLQDLLRQPFMIAAMESNMNFKDYISSWMNRRFKTNFRVEKIDLLSGINQQVSKIEDVIEEKKKT